MDMADDPSIPHGIKGYRGFQCKCDVCMEANRQFWRERKAAERVGKLRVVSSPVPDGTPGEVERSVIAECAALDEPNTALVATAKVMARILDNPNQVSQHATASRQLTSILETLSPKQKRKSKGRLASVRQMTNRKTAL